MDNSPDSLNDNSINPNIEWAAVFVNELARSGLTKVCIAPGSRSTPLAMAFNAHPGIKVYVHLDERSAAFFALGIALAENKPAALVCTSGTAAANFYPALIEAKMSQVPLILLTADRPPELRHSGANQTIDQIKMFGDHVLWSVDAALPQADPPDFVLPYLRTLAARLFSSANGIVKGPVHLNFPFRKPLEPTNIINWQHVKKNLGGGQPFVAITTGTMHPSETQVSLLSDVIEKYPKGLIICGPNCPDADFPEIVTRLSKVSGYPILADPLSGLRFGPHIEETAVLGGYETYLQVEKPSWEKPDVILRFGAIPTSKWLNNYIKKNNNAVHIHVRESGIWADGDYSTNYLFQVSPSHLCRRLLTAVKRPVDSDWIMQWTKAEDIFNISVSQFMADKQFDGAFVSSLLNQMPNESSLFSGNSLAIRHVDQFCPPNKKSIRVYANRGASGIDGNISTGLGIAISTSEPVVLLVGDITFYHDSNGLLAIKKYGIDNVTIVILNNNGGGIFRRLPVSKFEPEFQMLFENQHDLTFKPLAKIYGLSYKKIADLKSFRATFSSALANNAATLIEVQTDAQTDNLMRMEIISLINSKL